MNSVFSFPDYGDDVDVKFMKGGGTDQVSLRVTQDLFTGGSEAVAGIQKLVQQVTLRLLTPSGGQIYEPAEGSQLLTDVLAGRTRTVDQARQSFSQTRDDLLRQFATDVANYPDIPPTEILANLELLQVLVERDSLYLYVKIVSLAGVSSAFNVPFNLT